MGMIDDLQKNAKDIMQDPAKRAKIHQIAEEKGISIEEAKAQFLKKKDE